MEDKIEKIKALIASKGITKGKVSERCGINSSTLSKYLAGKENMLGEKKVDLIIGYLERVNTNELP